MSIAPISPVEQPEATRPARASSIGREVLFALLAAVVVAGLGAPFGLLWSKLAPHVELVQTQYGPYPIDGEPEGYWADDGWFILMSIGMGVLLAVAAWFLLRRYRGPLLLAGLVVGSAAASVIGAWLGNKIGWDHYLDLAEHAPANTHIFRPVKLRTGTSSLAFGFLPWVRGTMLIQALAAAAVYTGLAGFHVSPTLRYDNIPPEYLTPPPPPPGAAYQPYPVPAPTGYEPHPVPGGPYPPPGAQSHPAVPFHPESNPGAQFHPDSNPGGPGTAAPFPAHPGGPAQAAQFPAHPGPHADGSTQAAPFPAHPGPQSDGSGQGPQFAAQPEPDAGGQGQGPQFAARPEPDAGGESQGPQLPGQPEAQPSTSGPTAQPVSAPPPTGSPWETAPTWTDPGAPPPPSAPAAPLWPSSDGAPPSSQQQPEPPHS